MLLGGGSGQEREKRGILSPKDVPCLGASSTSARVTPARHTCPPTHFSSRTGARVISVIRRQYQIMMIRMLGVRKVFMANHTFVKPPF